MTARTRKPETTNTPFAVETAEATTPKTRKPRTTNPVTAATIRYRKAKAAADKARVKAAKVAAVQIDLDAAVTEEAAAQAELVSLLGIQV